MAARAPAFIRMQEKQRRRGGRGVLGYPISSQALSGCEGGPTLWESQPRPLEEEGFWVAVMTSDLRREGGARRRVLRAMGALRPSPDARGLTRPEEGAKASTGVTAMASTAAATTATDTMVRDEPSISTASLVVLFPKTKKLS
jgi:hypothetical protein